MRPGDDGAPGAPQVLPCCPLFQTGCEAGGAARLGRHRGCVSEVPPSPGGRGRGRGPASRLCPAPAVLCRQRGRGLGAGRGPRRPGLQSGRPRCGCRARPGQGGRLSPSRGGPTAAGQPVFQGRRSRAGLLHGRASRPSSMLVGSVNSWPLARTHASRRRPAAIRLQEAEPAAGPRVTARLA